MRRIGVRVRRWRQEHAVSQMELAQRIEEESWQQPWELGSLYLFDQGALSRLELGITAPPDPDDPQEEGSYRLLARVMGEDEGQLLSDVRYECWLRAVDGPVLRQTLVKHLDAVPELYALPDVADILDEAVRRLAAGLDVQSPLRRQEPSLDSFRLVSAIVVWGRPGYMPSGQRPGRGREGKPTWAAHTDEMLALLRTPGSSREREALWRLLAPTDVVDLLLVLARRVCLDRRGVDIDWLLP